MNLKMKKEQKHVKNIFLIIFILVTDAPRVFKYTRILSDTIIMYGVKGRRLHAKKVVGLPSRTC